MQIVEKSAEQKEVHPNSGLRARVNNIENWAELNENLAKIEREIEREMSKK